MYLIIEKQKNKEVHAYVETTEHFEQADKWRLMRQLTIDDLDEECNLHEHGDNFYIVVPIKKLARKISRKMAKVKNDSRRVDAVT